MKQKNNTALILVLGGIFIAIMIIAGAIIYKGPNSNNNTTTILSSTLLDPNDPNASIIGDINAPLTIFIFDDFQCPYCKQLHEEAVKTIRESYVKEEKVKIILRNKAFLGPESVLAGQAAQCAKDQNAFENYADKLFAEQNGENRGTYINPNLKRFAKEIGLDENTFNTCLDSNKYESFIKAETKATDALGIRSTPTIFIDGQKIDGLRSFSYLQPIIDNALAKITK